MGEDSNLKEYLKIRREEIRKQRKINEQIKEERNKVKTTEELIEQAKITNEWAEDLGIDTKIIN